MYFNPLKRDERFRYLLLNRMREDCEYYLGHGHRDCDCLWAGDEHEQIELMKKLWDSFPEDGARRKILCKRFSTKSRMALENRADSGLDPLITESHGGQNGMCAGTA